MTSRIGDIYIAGRMVFVGNGVRREEDGPRINLSQFIRRIQFPPHLTRSKTKKKAIRRNLPKSIPLSQPLYDNLLQISSHRNKAVEIPRTQNYDPVALAVPIAEEGFKTVKINSTVSPKQEFSGIEVLRDKMALQRALVTSLEESKKSLNVGANAAHQKPDFNNNKSSRDEEMLQRVLDASLKESKNSLKVNATAAPQKPNFSAMSEAEQVEMAIKMSMQANDRSC